jgi:hypothetical protein
MAAIFGILLVIAAAKVYFWWILGAAALIGFWIAFRRALKRDQARLLARVREHDRLAAAADQQHAWEAEGDPRGTYGPDYQPLETDQ